MALSFGLAWAQAEPTIAEIYAMAQSGKLEQAQIMVQQVLISHPKSAKAHFVQSELYARQGNQTRAREAFALAEAEAPGLPFAKPEAVQRLRVQLSATRAPFVPSPAVVPDASPPATTTSNSWLLPVLLTGGMMLLGYFVFRKRVPQAAPQTPLYPSGLNGPQTFGASAPGTYGQPVYGQAPNSGLGGKIMGGVATGLAVGAGVVAAEAIGRSLMGNRDAHTTGTGNYGNGSSGSFDSNSDLGGQSFGISDTSSWDDVGSSSDGTASGDWDN
jgi:hypothetical protein